jgi:hypothetical protein
VDDAFSNIALGANGEWWPKHSYLMPIAALPFYWLFGIDGTLVFNLLTLLAMILLGYHLARRYAPPEWAGLATLAVAFTGPFWAYSYNFSNDGFYTVLILAALLSTLNNKGARGGALYGLAIWAKITNVLLLPVFLAALWQSESTPAQRRRFVIALLIPLGLYGLANWYMFGAPWISSYQRVLVIKGGELGIASHVSLFSRPYFTGLQDLLFSRHNGLVTAYPILCVSSLGLIPLFRRHRLQGAALLFVFLAYPLFYAPFEHYQERFLFPCFVLAAIPLGQVFQSLSNAAERFSLSSSAQIKVLIALVAGLAAVRVAGAFLPGDSRLSDRIEGAHVMLGNRHCDYFNNMRWAWECTEFMEIDSEYVGLNANHRHPFQDGDVDGYIFAQGHRTGAPRRIVFPNVPIKARLVMRYGLDQKSRPPLDTHIEVNVAGQNLLSDTITRSGELIEKRLDTAAWGGTLRDVVVTITSVHQHKSRLVFDGWMMAETP